MTTLQERITDLCFQHGSLRETARKLHIDVGYLSKMQTGQKTRPSKVTLEKLGLREVITYRVNL